MYLVKGYITQDETRKHVAVLTTDTESCYEAITTATKQLSIEDVTSVSLSPIKEFLKYDSSEVFFTAMVQPHQTDEGRKVATYQMLVEAKDFETAQRFAIQTLAEGYDMALVGLKKTKLYAVI